MDFKFSISEVASRTGISSSAINYYVRSKIITPPKKTSKTRALFSEKTIDELIEIKNLCAQEEILLQLLKAHCTQNALLSILQAYLNLLICLSLIIAEYPAHQI